ncbi:MAG: BolA/IbaG family iron-sulfur metabolism protein [Cocleimonas sp.]|nr:BolA/IbaG family iron-sulfur metabolism protein [Cocleimonas sp.]
MSMQETIKSKLTTALKPEVLDIIDETQQHNVPADSESHFKVVAVSKAFEGKMLIARHRMINEVLSEELAGSIHALSLHTMTPDEYFEKAGKVSASPECLGGGIS